MKATTKKVAWTRREFLRKALGGVASLALAPMAATAKRPSKRPNILFIMADDHTSQAWGCYGGRLAKLNPTKQIDRIRAQGALLRNCFCTNSICVPSRASILTGQYSHVNGAKTLADRLSSSADNVAKRLQSAGYETAIIGKWHLKERPSGFDYANVLRGQGRYHNPELYESRGEGAVTKTVHQGHSTDVITDLALRWLNERQDPEKPFCLMVHYKAVHEPYYSHDRFRDLYRDEEIEEPEDLLGQESPKGKRFQGWPLETLGQRFEKNSHRYSPPPLDADKGEPQAYRKAVYQKFVKDYLRTVAGLDENVGRLASYLDENGLGEDTAVIYTADQGYFLGEHNLFDKRFMLEESLRMPFIVRYPREIDPGTTVDDIVLNIDFAELFLDYAGAKIPDAMQGRSFRQNLMGRTPGDWRDAMYYRYWMDQPERPSHYGIRTKTHKLIYYDGLTRSGTDPDQCWELYDLQKDPHERVNVYDRKAYESTLVGLKKRLSILQKECKDG